MPEENSLHHNYSLPQKAPAPTRKTTVMQTHDTQLWVRSIFIIQLDYRPASAPHNTICPEPMPLFLTLPQFNIILIARMAQLLISPF
jgi:hypothetical protein